MIDATHSSTPEDSELLRRYADERSEAAFAELVRRRIGLVYSVALRQTRGDRHRAEDATQAVFTDLARKAATLARRPILAGWLHRSAQFAAIDLIRSESRRAARERTAYLMQTDLAPERSPADWEKVRPVLDQALNEIDDTDRDAILLRFFDNRPFADIGARLQLSENAARMRVERALDKLEAVLARHGVRSTAAALGTVLGGQLATGAPAGLAASVTSAALAPAAAATGGSLLGVLALGKVQLGAAAFVATAGAAAFFAQGQEHAALRREIAATRPAAQAFAALKGENQLLAARIAEVDTLRRATASVASLEQDLAEARAAVAQRHARAQAQSSRSDQNELDRLNKEGNALVGEYKALASRAKDTALTPDERQAADVAAKAKMEAIRAKQAEVNAVRARGQTAPPAFSSGPTLSTPGRIPAPGTLVTISLLDADLQTALVAYENFTGKKVVRDPSLNSTAGSFTFKPGRTTAEDATRQLTRAVEEQLGITFETAPDGTVIARKAAR